MSERKGLGDVEVHLALRSQEALSVSAGRWLGGALTSPSPVGFRTRRTCGCFGGRRSCGGQGGDGSPCCGRTRLDRHQGASGDRGARRPDVVSAQRPWMRTHRCVALTSSPPTANRTLPTYGIEDLVGSVPEPFQDQVVQELFRLEANPLLDSRLRTWATLADDSRSLLRCETDQVAPNYYLCKGANYRGGPAQNNPVCAPGGQPLRCQIVAVDTFVGTAAVRATTPAFTSAIRSTWVVTCPSRSRRAAFNASTWSLRAPRSVQSATSATSRPPMTFSTESSRAPARALPISGDLTCTRTNNDLQDQIPTAIGLFTNADASEAEQEALSAGAMLEACFADLSRLVPDLQGRDRSGTTRICAESFRPRAASIWRFWSSLRWASAPTMLQAMDPQARERRRG